MTIETALHSNYIKCSHTIVCVLNNDQEELFTEIKPMGGLDEQSRRLYQDVVNDIRLFNIFMNIYINISDIWSLVRGHNYPRSVLGIIPCGGSEITSSNIALIT